MLLLQLGVLPFEQLQLCDLAGRAGGRRLRGSTAEPTIARLLPRHLDSMKGWISSAAATVCT